MSGQVTHALERDTQQDMVSHISNPKHWRPREEDCSQIPWATIRPCLKTAREHSLVVGKYFGFDPTVLATH